MTRKKSSATPRRNEPCRSAAQSAPPRQRSGPQRGPVPVATAVLGAVALMALCQLRLAADESADAPASATSPASADAQPASPVTPVESPPAPPVDEPANAPREIPGQTPAGATRDVSTDSAAPADRLRLREGTQLTNRLGHFRQSGDSVAFIDDSGREIGGLPNLNLERITRMLKAAEEPEGVWWSISGTITEFAGRNYVLVTRAVYKAAAPPPAPESLAP